MAGSVDKLKRTFATGLVAAAIAFGVDSGPVTAPVLNGEHYAMTFPPEAKTWRGLMDKVFIPEAELKKISGETGLKMIAGNPSFGIKFDDLSGEEVGSYKLNSRIVVEVRGKPDIYSGMVEPVQNRVSRVRFWVNFGSTGKGARWRQMDIGAWNVEGSGYRFGDSFRMGMLLDKFNKPYLVIEKDKQGRERKYEVVRADWFFNQKVPDLDEA